MNAYSTMRMHGQQVNVIYRTMIHNADIWSEFPDEMLSYMHMTKDQIVPTAVDISEIVRQGVYFLVHNGEVEYVGQTVNLHARMRGHEKRQPYHLVAFLPVEEERFLGMIETYYIELFDPPLNVKKMSSSLQTFRWKESLRKRIKKEKPHHGEDL